MILAVPVALTKVIEHQQANAMFHAGDNTDSVPGDAHGKDGNRALALEPSQADTDGRRVKELESKRLSLGGLHADIGRVDNPLAAAGMNACYVKDEKRKDLHRVGDCDGGDWHEEDKAVDVWFAETPSFGAVCRQHEEGSAGNGDGRSC